MPKKNPKWTRNNLKWILKGVEKNIELILIQPERKKLLKAGEGIELSIILRKLKGVLNQW